MATAAMVSRGGTAKARCVAPYLRSEPLCLASADAPAAASQSPPTPTESSMALGARGNSWTARPRPGCRGVLRLLPLFRLANRGERWRCLLVEGQPFAGRCRNIGEQSTHLYPAVLVQLLGGRSTARAKRWRRHSQLDQPQQPLAPGLGLHPTHFAGFESGGFDLCGREWPCGLQALSAP